ncbi:hypothetical protein PHYBOEH_006907 [Phytophthora boehmeriae]|uniref:START domain-containing protein n=1 Tax=Phytophthora boehmeriae TaxID=109152 RepID=A0A8T1WGT2_9STRA|nr:hypothetical protein PHYBOEH_006907 [Phytophthora boehmeriae]
MLLRDLDAYGEVKQAPKTRPRGSKRRIRHYERQKHEKEALQLEIVELTETLERERLRKKSRKERKPPAPVVHSVWEALAQRRLEKRLAAESQRTWLKTAITGKVALAEDLKAVVRQHMRIASLIAAQSPEQRTELFLDPTDDLLYTMDIQDTMALYPHTDAVFSSSGLDPTAETEEFQRTITTAENGVSIQYAWKQHMMFSFKQTCQSVWMLGHLLHRQEDREEFDSNPNREEIMAMKFRVSGRLAGGERAFLSHRVVTRKFVEDDRMVMVAKSFIAGEGACSGMQVEETGWTIIRPSTTGSGTIVEVCFRQVPVHLNSANSVPELVTNKFNDLLQTMIQDNSAEVTRGMESLLLDDVLHGIHM